MAIDSAEKRRSILFNGVPPGFVSPTPNASKDAEWRAQFLGLYSGIALDAPAAGGSNPVAVTAAVAAPFFRLGLG